MTFKKAFTIIELLISLTISSFIILGMMQGYQNVMRFIDKSRQIMNINRKISLLFHQMEQDITAAYIPHLAEQEKTGGKKSKESEASIKDDDHRSNMTHPELDEKVSEKKAPSKDQPPFFSSKFQEGFTRKEGDHKVELFDQLSFITTTPLHIYGQQRVRLVRVCYCLQKDKALSTKERTYYSLVRKETTDLLNVDVKIKEVNGDQPAHSIRTYLVADKIKDMSLECFLKQTPGENKEKKTAEELPMITSFAWGSTPQTKDQIPNYVVVHISFWHDKKASSSSFRCTIPILATSRKETKKEDALNPSIPQGERRHTDASSNLGSESSSDQVPQSERRHDAAQAAHGDISRRAAHPDASKDFSGSQKAGLSAVASTKVGGKS